MLKKIITILFILIVLIAGVFAFLYFTQKDSGSGGRGISVRDFFPFGQESSTPATTPSQETENRVPVETAKTPTVPPDLRQIYAYPVSGAGAFSSTSTTVVRFIDKATGNLYEAETDLDIVTRISNTTIPKVYSAIFSDKNSVVLRYAQDDTDLIETVYGKVATSTATSTAGSVVELKTVYLDPNIKELVLSDKNDRILSITQSGTGSIGTLSKPDGTTKTQLFTSPIREWVPQWLKTNTVTLTTKASTEVAGFMYSVNTTNGVMQPILSNIFGLTTLTNNIASTTLFTYSTTDGIFALQTYDWNKKVTTQFPLSPTFVDKCVWSKKNADLVYCAVPHTMPKGDYPDAWYKGLVSFSDDIWRVNVSTGNKELVAELKTISGRDLDVINPSLDGAENYFVFTNKTDLTLWSYKLKN